MLTFALGDIHGRLDLLRIVVEKCLVFSDDRDEDFKFIFLGDYIDRGPDSAGVIAFLRAWRDRAPEQIVMLKGNHEQMFVENIHRWPSEEPAIGSIASIDARPETYRSFFRDGVDPIETAEFLKRRPTFYDDGLRYFVHAGVRPGISLADQDDEDRLWIRGDFLFALDAVWERYIVHGHSTTMPLGTPQRFHNRLNLDTGACWPEEGGKLTAAVFTDRITLPIAFAQA